MKFYYWIVPALLILSCSGKKSDGPAAAEYVPGGDTISALPEAILTPQQEKEGWKVLFDGKTLKGWHVYKNQPNNSWEIRNGILHCKPFEDRKENKRSDLITDDSFENFELTFDWKISPQGNSGVIYRANEEFEQPYQSGAEYQVIDDIGYPGKLEDWQKTGAAYAMYSATGAKPNPVGEWNTSRILVKDDHAEHWLNGVKVVQYDFASADWMQKKDAGKWKDAKGYGVTKLGHIDLQDHANEAWFRNIAIRTL